MSNTNRFQRIENIVQKHIQQGRFSGVEWLIKRKGKIWAQGRAGYSDAIARTEMPEKPIYRIYSIRSFALR